MLTVMDSRPNRNCGVFYQREFLRIGALGLGALALPQCLAGPALLGFEARRGVTRQTEKRRASPLLQ